MRDDSIGKNWSQISVIQITSSGLYLNKPGPEVLNNLHVRGERYVQEHMPKESRKSRREEDI
jgi:hypothetical protein